MRHSRASQPARQQQWDSTHFTSREDQEWYELREDRNFIIESSVAEDVDAYFHVTEFFVKLGRDPILWLPPYICPHLVKEFYANIEEKDSHSGSYFETTIRGRRIELSRRGLARLLGYHDERERVALTKRF